MRFTVVAVTLFLTLASPAFAQRDRLDPSWNDRPSSGGSPSSWGDVLVALILPLGVISLIAWASQSKR